MPNTEHTRRAAAFKSMEAFARKQGFPFPTEEDHPDRVVLIATAPDGRNFGIGYLKTTAQERLRG